MRPIPFSPTESFQPHAGLSEIDYLRAAHAAGKWGFRVPVLILPGSNFVTAQAFVSDALLVNEMPAWMARPWTITLSAYGFQATTNATLTNTQPASNQVFSSQRTRCQVEWGIDGSTETAVIDYPARGCIFSINAASIRVKIFSELAFPGLAQLPIYSGFMMPYPRAVQGGETWPQFTTAFFTLNATGGQVNTPIPARASAYRIIFDVFPPAGQITLQQSNQSQTVIVTDALAPTPNEQDAQNAAAYYPLHPAAQFINATNGDASPHNVAIQFLLDLG